MIESPYAGDVESNVRYAVAAVRDSALRGEAPYASHIMLAASGALDDDDRDERRIGVACGLEWASVAELVAVYTDRGITPGMVLAINAAERRGIPVEYRTLEEG